MELHILIVHHCIFLLLNRVIFLLGGGSELMRLFADAAVPWVVQHPI